MDIGFIEEQELLCASARGFLENECPSAFPPPAHGGAGGDHRRLLAKARRTGLVRHSLLRRAGGSGLGLVDMTVLMEEMGLAVMMPGAEEKLAAEVAQWMNKAAARDTVEDRRRISERRGDELPDWVANK